jgi:hypothetical protein
MKKVCLAIALAGIVATPSLFAAMSVTLVDSAGNTTGNTYSYGNGGEFRAVGDAGLNAVVNWNAYSTTTSGTTSDAVDGGSWGYNSGLAVAGQKYFQTFCIEYTEEFIPGGTYAVSMSGNALYGHLGPPNGVPVTMGTAWLYSQFAAGTLSGYNYTYGSGRTASAGSLQQAIWYLQGENGGVDNSLVTLALNAVGAANLLHAANGAFDVEALNLGDPGAAQDQLVIVTDPIRANLVAVPEPTTMVAGAGALGLALLGIGRARRSTVVRIG